MKSKYHSELTLCDGNAEFEMINNGDEVIFHLTNEKVKLKLSFTGEELELLRRLIQ